MRNKPFTCKLVAFFFIAMLFAPQFAIAKNKRPGRPTAAVEVAQVIERKTSETINLVGTIHALKQSEISAEVDGRVVSFTKSEGTAVKKADLVVALDETPYRIQAQGARGRLSSARVALKKAELAKKRARKLFEQKIASEEMWQNAELDVETANADLVQRMAELEQAELDLDRCRARAPYDGYISRKLTEVGVWVQDGTGLFEIIDIKQVDVVVEAPERSIRQFALGTSAKVFIDAYPQMKFSGTVATVSPLADLKSRTFMVKIRVDNSNAVIKAGMSARVKVGGDGKRKTMLIPRDAILWRARKAIVFTVTDGTVKEITVSLGRQMGELVVATGDIYPGLKLVVTGNEILRNGDPVKIVGEKTFN